MAQPAARILRADARANAEKILASARALLSERGPEGLTVSEVAHRAGVNRSTAYQHFRTRDDLVAAVMAEIGREVTALLRQERPIGVGLAIHKHRNNYRAALLVLGLANRTPDS